MSRFRILSIDGGGLKGVFPAAFLSELQKNLSAPVQSYFDLIAGTSTGGIIALGLAFGLTPQGLVNFYVERGPKIFPPRTGLSRLLANARSLTSPRYNPAALRGSLEHVFGATKLGELKARLIIPSISAASGEIYIYKTPYHPRLRTDYKASVVDVALATSAAPTFLPAHLSNEGVPFLDGGLWANNPTGLAVVDAISMLEVPRDNIEVLSIGCTQAPKSFATIRGDYRWARAAIDAAIAGQSFASLGTAYQLVGHDHVERINVSVEPRRFELDGTRNLGELIAHGTERARHAISELLPRFFTETATPYEPCYRLDGTPEAQR